MFYDELKVNGYYCKKTKRCFAKVELLVHLQGKDKTFIGKGDCIKHTDDIENEGYAKDLASTRAIRDAFRQKEDYLLMYSHRFSKAKVKKAKKIVLTEEEFNNHIEHAREFTATEYAFKKSKPEIHITNKGIDTLLDLIGGMANPIFTKGMMGK